MEIHTISPTPQDFNWVGEYRLQNLGNNSLHIAMLPTGNPAPDPTAPDVPSFRLLPTQMIKIGLGQPDAPVTWIWSGAPTTLSARLES